MPVLTVFISIARVTFKPDVPIRSFMTCSVKELSFSSSLLGPVLLLVVLELYMVTALRVSKLDLSTVILVQNCIAPGLSGESALRRDAFFLGVCISKHLRYPRPDSHGRPFV